MRLTLKPGGALFLVGETSLERILGTWLADSGLDAPAPG